MGDVAVTSVKQQVLRNYQILNYGAIYVSSYGRGIWMDTTYYMPLGIEPVNGNVNRSYRLELSPNPVNDILNVTYTNETSGNVTLSVYDLSGRIVITSTLGNQPKGVFNTTVSLSGLLNGTYIVKVGNGFGKIVKR
jgi:hypothetical protein